MRSRVIVCTEDSVAWECLRRACAADTIQLERANTLDELATIEGLAVAALVIEDRLAPLLPYIERALGHSALALHNAVVITVGEALAAQWTGLLSGRDGFSPAQLLDWVAEHRMAPVTHQPASMVS